MMRMRQLAWYRVALVCGAALAIVLLTAMSGTGEILLPAMLVCSLVLGGVGYGVTAQKAHAAHERADRHEAAVAKLFANQDTKLDEMSKMLTEIRVLIASDHPAAHPPTARPEPRHDRR